MSSFINEAGFCMKLPWIKRLNPITVTQLGAKVPGPSSRKLSGQKEVFQCFHPVFMATGNNVELTGHGLIVQSKDRRYFFELTL